MKRIIQEQTAGGCFNSTIELPEAILFSQLSPANKEEYMQEIYFSKGHGEGAENLIRFADAIKQFGKDCVSSYTILI